MGFPFLRNVQTYLLIACVTFGYAVFFSQTKMFDEFSIHQSFIAGKTF